MVSESCHYQGNQWQLPEALWLLDRLEDCSMHQSLIQEITSASAISNASSRKEKKTPCDCSVLRLKTSHWAHSCGEFPSGTKAPTKCDKKKSHFVWRHCSRSCRDTYKTQPNSRTAAGHQHRIKVKYLKLQGSDLSCMTEKNTTFV